MVHLTAVAARSGGGRGSLLPGILACAGIALAAMGVAAPSGVPGVLIALLLGMALRPFAIAAGRWEGIDFSMNMLLRIGIVFIGFRLSLGELSAIGAPAVAIGVGAVVTMLTGGYLFGRLFGLDRQRALLSAGSVGICGASAALAISTVLDRTAVRERQTSYAVCAVTLLSTLAMVTYPLLTTTLGLSDRAAGIFLGASIHDVTQVIGAGAMISPEALEAATLTKLVRVACLAPAVIVIGMAVRTASGTSATVGAPLIPWFIYGFAAAAAVASLGVIPDIGIRVTSELTTFFLVTATAALGLKTSVRSLASDGWRPALAIIAQTLMLAALMLGAVTLFLP